MNLYYNVHCPFFNNTGQGHSNYWKVYSDQAAAVREIIVSINILRVKLGAPSDSEPLEHHGKMAPRALREGVGRPPFNIQSC